MLALDMIRKVESFLLKIHSGCVADHTDISLLFVVGLLFYDLVDDAGNKEGLKEKIEDCEKRYGIGY